MLPPLYDFNIVISLIFFFIMGLCFGSFFNVLIDRLPKGKSIKGRSHCDHCKHVLGFFDLIPVFSYIFLRGRCRYCKKKISAQNLFVELLTGVAFLLTWMFFPDPYASSTQLLGYFLLTASSIIIIGADFKYHIIPDSATVLLIIAGLLIGRGDSIATQLVGGIVLFLILFAIYFLSKGRAMGFGDVKLAFGMGVLLGLFNGLIALYISFAIGGIISLILLLKGSSSLKSKIAFGPFLIAGTVITLYFNNQIQTIIQRIF